MAVADVGATRDVGFGDEAINEVTRNREETARSEISSESTTATPSGVFSGFLMSRRISQFQQRKFSQSPGRMASFGKNLKYVTRVSSRSLNNLTPSKLYNSFPNLARKENQIERQNGFDDDNVKKVLKAVESDHVVSTNVADNRNRRSVYIEKETTTGMFGFTIQSYTFRHAKTRKVEQITYVDYVDLDSPAFVAGLRAGDIILAINGRNVQNETHQQLVAYIGQCSSVRMVVLFENCVNRIDLCARAIKLKKLLADKEFELRMLQLQEGRILSGMPPFTDVEILALLRTPCNTPRSVSFSLPKNESDAVSRLIRTLVPSQSTVSSFMYIDGEEGGALPESNGDDSNSDMFNEQEDGASRYVEDVTNANVAPTVIIEDEAAGRKCPGENRSTSSVRLPSWDKRKATFIIDGSTSDSASYLRSSTESSVRHSLASSISETSEVAAPCVMLSDYSHGDDLALIHVLHIDDADCAGVYDTPTNVVTHF